MNRQAHRMLVISPHPDDCILGAGGTMARFADAGGKVTVLTVAVHSPPLFSEDIQHLSLEEARKAHSVIGVADSIFLNIPALSIAQLPQWELNKQLSEVVRKVDPHILLLPSPDRNMDHRAVFESGMVVSRPFLSGNNISVVASYEVLSSTHYNAPYIEPNFIPNWNVDIAEFIDIKIKALKCCGSHIGPMPHPRSCEAVRSLAVFRGSQAGMKYGEDFYLIRMTSFPSFF
ncbi:MAG: PIG-L family deacetylase [Candidatus Electrothrix sp. AW5]|nr:PIG-L family deacetylase [Candidatus Electrothrix gigas]